MTMLENYPYSWSEEKFVRLFEQVNKQVNPSYVEKSQFRLGFNMTSRDINPFKMVVTGCQGEGTPAQNKVASAMNAKIKGRYDGKKVGLLLGDNFYDSGVDSIDDPKFDKLFKQMYSQMFYWFAALGNHDWNFQNSIKSWIGSSTSHQHKAMTQVERTYCSANGIDKVDTWLMPHRYYVIETNWANIIVLDSNTLCFDPAQQAWFKEILQQTRSKCAHRKNIVAMHHPLISVGKRFPGSCVHDVSQYILPEYNYTKSRNTSLNNLLLTLFDAIKTELKDDFVIDLILCAHDHFLAESYIPFLGCKQLTIGGGGGPLQSVQLEKASEFSQKTHGFVEIKIDETNIEYIFYNEGLTVLHKGNIVSRGAQRNPSFDKISIYSSDHSNPSRRVIGR